MKTELKHPFVSYEDFYNVGIVYEFIIYLISMFTIPGDHENGLQHISEKNPDLTETLPTPGNIEVRKKVMTKDVALNIMRSLNDEQACIFCKLVNGV